MNDSIKRNSQRVLFAFAAVPLIVALAQPRHDTALPRASRTVWDSVYSVAQAARGESLYAASCARCHGASLSGADESPPLAGGAFLGNWNGLPLSDLQTRIRTTMPSDSVGIYDRQLVTDVMAHLLRANGFPPGPAALPTDLDSLKGIVIRTSKP